MVIYPPFKREHNVSWFTLPITSSSSKISTSKEKYAPTPCVSKILTTPSAESCVEHSALSRETNTKKKETTMKKEFNANDIISSSRKRHSTFRTALKDKESNVSPVPSPSETEDLMPGSETSSLSSYPPFTSSISLFENECHPTKGLFISQRAYGFIHWICFFN